MVEVVFSPIDNHKFDTQSMLADLPYGDVFAVLVVRTIPGIHYIENRLRKIHATWNWRSRNGSCRMLVYVKKLRRLEASDDRFIRCYHHSNIMSYYELWTILNSWKHEFRTNEFARTFASPNPRKVLHDLSRKGFLEHLGYGRYRVRGVEDYVRARNDLERGYDLLRRSELHYALTDVDGVFVWTKGGYNAGRFFGFYPIHLRVRGKDVPKWKSLFRKAGRKYLLATSKPRETMFSVFYVLHPVGRIKAETVGGLNVEPLGETVDFCKTHAYTYEPALEMLDKEYRLGLKVKYAHV